MIAIRILSILLTTLGTSPSASAASVQAAVSARSRAAEPLTIVYVVRHAEKSDADPTDRDPALSPAGIARTESLVAALQDASIDAAFATEYKRTQLTVQPVAAAHHIEVTITDARNPAALAQRITEEFRGHTVLVAGHSNTVPVVLKALGIADAPKLAESDYDDLFIVTLAGDALPALLHLHYGAADVPDAGKVLLAQQAGQMLDAFHAAAARADEDLYFGCFEPDGLFLGTDATERWTLDEFKTFALPYFQGDSAWVYTPVDRKVNVSDDLRYAWFDEQLTNAKYGPCRGSGVLHRSAGKWRIVQYHLTMPIPNDLAVEFAKRIAAHQSDGK